MIRDEPRSWAGLLAPVVSHKRLLAAALLAAALAQATVVGAWVLAAWMAGQAAMGAPGHFVKVGGGADGLHGGQGQGAQVRGFDRTCTRLHGPGVGAAVDSKEAYECRHDSDEAEEDRTR